MDDQTRIGVFVCGGRDFRDAELLTRVLDAVDGRPGIDRVIETGDRAGRIAAEWATAFSVRVLTVHGDRMSSVGLSRLADRIVAAGQPDLAIGFAGGRRTAALLEELSLRGVRVRSIEPAVQQA